MKYIVKSTSYDEEHEVEGFLTYREGAILIFRDDNCGELLFAGSIDQFYVTIKKTLTIQK